jgi:cytochrome P450
MSDEFRRPRWLAHASEHEGLCTRWRRERKSKLSESRANHFAHYFSVQNLQLPSSTGDAEPYHLQAGLLPFVPVCFAASGAAGFASLPSSPRMSELALSPVASVWAACCLVAAVFIAALFVADARARGSRGSTPGPAEYPFIGALLWLQSSRRSGLLEELTARSAGALTWSARWPLNPRYFFLTSPACIAHVLRDNFDNYEKGDMLRSKLSVLLGSGIFASDGEAWRAQRALSSRVLSAAAVAGHGGGGGGDGGGSDGLFAAVLPPLAALASRCGAAADAGAAVDLHALMHAFTLDAIGLLAFGEDIGALRGDGGPGAAFARAFDAVQALAEARFFSPGWRLLERLDGTRARIDAGVAELDAYCAALVARRRAAGDAGRRSDLLSRFMAAEAEALRGAPPSAADDAALRDVVLNFLIAGRDTTAQALSWAVHALCAAPAAQARLVTEARAVLGDGRAPLAYETAARKLPFATAVLKETLRLHPSVPKDVKVAVADDVLPDGTRIPAGAAVAWLPWCMGRLDALWPNPAAFDPDRFLGAPQPSPFLFTAFNAGPRTCLGQHLAIVEGAAVLATLHREFEFELVPGQRIDYAESLTLPMKNGMRVYVRRRPA